MKMARAQEVAASLANKRRKRKRGDNMRDITSCNNTNDTTRIASSSITDSVTDSPLFKLSPELRNAIYRYKLVTEESVYITKQQGIPEPALLSSCKIIRSEATGIFYSENMIICKMVNYDCSALRLIARKCKTGHMKGKVERLRNDQRIWKDLVSWLRVTHGGTCGGMAGIVEGFEAEPEECMFAALFALVYESRACGGTWEDAERLIQHMRPTMIALNYDWTRD